MLAEDGIRPPQSLGAVDQRLALAEPVARWKWANHKAIEDRPREAELLVSVEKRAAQAGVDPAFARTFFEDQIAASKDVQNALFATADYWDMNAETRDWSRSYLAAVGQMPTMLQSGTYGVALHYLRAVQASGSVEAGTVMAQMQNQPVDNIFIRNASLRGDGRVVRGMYLARVKTPEQSKAPWDYLELVREVRAEDAVRPASESMCPLLRKT